MRVKGEMKTILPTLLLLVVMLPVIVSLSSGGVSAGAADSTGNYPRAGTFVAVLKTAPYPYHGSYGDTALKFYDYTDPQTGVHYHTNRHGDRFSEKENYSDGSVLFHIPPHFNPGKPFAFVVFFHGIETNIRKCTEEFDLTGQVDASQKNIILVLPQLARDAADSSPGKFFKANAFGRFMDEAAGVLASRMGHEYRHRLRKAPILVTAFSGGYKTTAYVLDRGGVSGRIMGVVLLDALYEDVDKFEKWAVKHISRSFLVSLYTHGGCERNSLELAGLLHEKGIAAVREWPEASLACGKFYVVSTEGSHMEIPLAGPPSRPLLSLLCLLDVRKGMR